MKSMTQEKTWNREYSTQKFLTNENEPQADVVRFVRFIRKKANLEIDKLFVIDLGSGTGRNSFYFAESGAKVLGLEISGVAIDIANKYLSEAMSKRHFDIKYVKQSIGEKFPCEDNSIDVALDVTSSNSLTEVEREVYLSETHRVLKNSGYFFVKALCKDGDENAKYLLKNNHGKEIDTYIMPETGIIERIWSRDNFVKTYEKYFTILELEKKTTYSKINNRSYKRNFWIAYMKK